MDGYTKLSPFITILIWTLLVSFGVLVVACGYYGQIWTTEAFN